MGKDDRPPSSSALPTVTGGDEKHYLLISDLKELVLSREAIFHSFDILIINGSPH
uniref:Uncharacterized protein n=1 Tax=Anguilla anguilla TaxID=7936 RepID=A0A0E9VPW7_ANGAN